MDLNLQKMLLAASTSLVAITSLLNADYDDAQLRNLENRVCILEQKKGACGMINPAARPTVCNGVDLFVTGEFIYWKPSENGLGFAIENEDGVNVQFGSGFLSDGDVKNPKFKWSPGFKVGLGWNLPHDGWDVYLNWTRLHAHTKHNHSSAPSGGLLIPTFENPFIIAPGSAVLDFVSATDATSRWKLHLNVLDGTLGREFFVSKWLTLRPFGGVRSAWVQQKLSVEYDYATTPTITTEDVFTCRNKYWGIGLLAGLNSEWGLGCGFSLFGDAAISLLYGNIKVHERERIVAPSPTTVRMKVHDDQKMGRAVTDLAAGVRWETYFCDDDFRLRLQAGWEQHMFFGQNQLVNFVDSFNQGKFVSNQGDLSLQGLTVSAQFDF